MKILVVGLGGAGKLHLRGYRNLGVEVFVYDVDPEREIGSKIGDVHGDYDFVDVCVPTHKHFTVCKRLLENKQNVLVEKPMCLKIDNALKLIDLAKENNVKLGVCHNQLYYPIYDHIDIKGLTWIGINRTNDEVFPDWVYSKGGGIPFEVGYHALYTYFYLAYVNNLPHNFHVKQLKDGVYRYVFDSGFIQICSGSKHEDFINLVKSNNCLRLRPWFNSPSLFPDWLYQFNLYWFLLKHRGLPYSFSHQGVFVDFMKHVEGGMLNFKLSPNLSLSVLKVLDGEYNVL